MLILLHLIHLKIICSVHREICTRISGILLANYIKGDRVTKFVKLAGTVENIFKSAFNYTDSRVY